MSQHEADRQKHQAHDLPNIPPRAFEPRPDCFRDKAIVQQLPRRFFLHFRFPMNELLGRYYGKFFSRMGWVNFNRAKQRQATPPKLCPSTPREITPRAIANAPG